MTTAPLDSRLSVLFWRIEGSRSLFANERDADAANKSPGTPMRRPMDLRWSRDSRRLVCVMGEPIVFAESFDRSAPLSIVASNASGSVRMAPPATFHGMGGAIGKDDAISADFTRDDTIVSAHASGIVRVAGRKLGTYAGARLVRASPTGARLAIVAEQPPSSSVHLLDMEGHALAHVEGGLVPGGVAWSPDGEHFAIRTATGIEVRDASGAHERTIDLASLAEKYGVPSSGRIGWTQRGIVALHGPHLVHVGEGDAVRVLEFGTDAHSIALTTSGDGRFAAMTTPEEMEGLRIADLETGETGVVRWATHFTEVSPISFSPDGHALAWAGYTGQLQMVPFGDVPIDASGLAHDPEQMHVQRFWNFVRGAPGTRAGVETASDAKIREVIDEIKRTSLRESLQTDASSLRSSLEAVLRDRQKRASTDALFKAAPVAPYAVGDAVKHAKFGDGKVTAVDGSGDTARITVAFADGTRSMRPSFLSRA